MQTITEMAATIAAANGWKGDAERNLHRTIRTLVARGLVPATEVDQRGTKAVEDKEIFRVRLFVALMNVGFEGEELHWLGDFVDPPADFHAETIVDGTRVSEPVWENADRFDRRSDQVVAATRRGEVWFFKALIHRDSGGGRALSAGFVREAELTEKTPDEVNKFREFQGLRLEAEIIVPVSEMFRALF